MQLENLYFPCVEGLPVNSSVDISVESNFVNPYLLCVVSRL